MQTTGIFTVHNFEIEFEELNEPIYLFPFGDIHRSAPLCDVERWIEFNEWAATKKNAYFLGMGDYEDFLSTSERTAIKNSGLHDSTLITLDDLAEDHIQRFYNETYYMKDKIIGYIEGNHYYQFDAGFTSTQRLAHLMGTKYLGVSSFIRLSFKKKEWERSRGCIDIWAHHGKGNGRKAGTSLNKVEDMILSANADIYLMGHDHKKSCAYVSSLELTSSKGGVKLKQKKRLLARTGSFLKGYVEDKASYVADMALNPTDLGVVKIELTPKRNRKEGDESFYIDIHTSI